MGIRLIGSGIVIRPLVALGFALVLTAFLPAALACEVAAQGHASCTVRQCGSTEPSMHCASEAALKSAPLARAGGSDLPAMPVANLVPTLAAHASPPLPPAWVPFAGKSSAPPQPSTLFAQGVLLRL